MSEVMKEGRLKDWNKQMQEFATGAKVVAHRKSKRVERTQVKERQQTH